MTEGLTDSLTFLVIATAICGLTTWMVSTGPRYSGQMAKGVLRGLGFGLLMLLPFVALMPFYLWAVVPNWVLALWIIGTISYEAVIWLTVLKLHGSRRGLSIKDTRNTTLGMQPRAIS